MSKLFQTTSFNFGFASGVVLFVLLMLFSFEDFHTKNPQLKMFSHSGGYSYGFPFEMYRAEMGFPNRFYFVWPGLFADILIAFAFSFLIGLICQFVWSKIASRRVKLK